MCQKNPRAITKPEANARARAGDPDAAGWIRDAERLSAGRPCDITGIEDYKHLDESGFRFLFRSNL